jgi:hypothetical protein
MRKQISNIILLLVLLPSIALAAIDAELPDLGEPYDEEITFNRIRNAFANGHYDLAVNLSLEALYVKARQKLLDEKNILVVAEWLGEELQDILNRTDLTDKEKGEEVVKVILSTLEPYEFVKSDTLGISLKHSIEYGATYISWEDKTAYDTCWGWYVSVVYYDECDNYGCETKKKYEYEYIKEYLTQVPDYYIYRIVDGEQVLVTKIKGYKNVDTKSYSLSSEDGWTDLLSSAYDYYQDIPEAALEEGRLSWLDLHSDVRSAGETLSYRVVANLKPYKAGSCGSSTKYSSTISADADGDGKMDFIPTSAYQKYFGKYYGWMIPVLSMIN